MSKRNLIFNLPYNCSCNYPITDSLRFFGLLIDGGITNIENFNEKIVKIQLLEFLHTIVRNSEYFVNQFEYIKDNIDTGVHGKKLHEKIFEIFYNESNLKNINIDNKIELNDEYMNLIYKYFCYEEDISFRDFIEKLNYQEILYKGGGFYKNFNLSMIMEILMKKQIYKCIDDFTNDLVNYFEKYNNYNIIINIATEAEQHSKEIKNKDSLMSKYNMKLYKKY